MIFMGWEYYNGKPQFYSYPNYVFNSGATKKYEKNGVDPGTGSLHYWSWQTGSIFKGHDIVIKYTNDTEGAIRLKSYSIKTTACDSGGLSYWAWGGLVETPCVGYGGTYYTYVNVTNDNGKTYQSSSVANVNVPNLSKTNMNYRGSDATHSASFGNPPQYPEGQPGGMTGRVFELTDCPAIQPGGYAYVHLGVGHFNDPATDPISTVIRFKMDPGEMEVIAEPAENPVIWRFSEDKDWHLVKTLFKMTSSGWEQIDN